MSQPSALRAKIRRTSNFVSLFMPLVTVLGSCGGTASSTRPNEPPAAAAGTGGSSSAGSSASGSGSGGDSDADTSGAGAASAGAMSTGGGGAAGDSSSAGGGAGAGAAAGAAAGAGGESNCVDVCALYGPTCCTPSVTCIAADARCVIDFYDVTLEDTTYQYADLEETVAALPQFFSPSVSTADVEWVGADAPATARIELHLSTAASAQYGNALEGADRHPFRVSCDGQSLFVGQVSRPESAAALQTPVLHVSRDVDGSVILRLAAWQGVWGLANTTMNLAARERLDRPELRATLCLAGALNEVPSNK